MSKTGSLFQDSQSCKRDRRVPKIIARQHCESQNSGGWEEKKRILRRKSSLLACRSCMAKTRKNRKSFLEGLEENAPNQRGALCIQTQKFETAGVVQKRRVLQLAWGRVCVQRQEKQKAGLTSWVGPDGGELGIPCWEYLVSMTHRVLDRIRI